MASINEFKVLIQKLSIIFFTIIFLFIVLYFITVASSYKPDTNEYLFALLDKNSSLEKKDEKGRNRMIFVGGSNLAFGLDSERIENRFNKKVINMGLHADMGLKFMLNELREKLRHGDTIIIVPEYEHFFGNTFEGGETLAYIFLFVDNSLISKLDFVQALNQLQYIPKLIRQEIKNVIIATIKRKKIEIDNSVVYQRKFFNNNGDMVGHLEKADVRINDNFIKEKKNEEVVKYINNFAMDVSKQNVEVIFLYPDYIDSSFEKNKFQIEELKKELQNELKIKILSTPERYKLDNDYFFDTIYHLNKKGRELRTKMVIEDIEKVIK